MAVYSAAAWSTSGHCPRCLRRVKTRDRFRRADRPLRLAAAVQDALRDRRTGSRRPTVAP